MRALLVGAALLSAACGKESVVTPPAAPTPDAKPITVGDRVPDLHVANASVPGGPPMGVVPGKVNILWFFATWSAPDKQAMPKAQEVWMALRGRGLAMVPVSVNDEEKGIEQQLVEFGRDNGSTFSIGWDRGHEMASRYRPGAEPTWYIVDRKGIVRFIHEGYREGEFVEMRAECESLL